MAQKKSPAKKKAPATVLQKVSATASHLKDEIVLGKNHLIEVAGDAIESIRQSVHKITHTGKVAKKSAKVKAKKGVKRAAKKTIKRVAAKKFAPVKKIKKLVKKK